jgi:hypothetical protein
VRRFPSDQVRPFRYVLTEAESPFQIEARRKGDTFAYDVSSAEWKFLESLMAQPPDLLPPDGSRRSEFWARLLGYGIDEEIDFVMIEGESLPEDLFRCWPDNVAWEYECWERDRREYEEWLKLGERVAGQLPEPADWDVVRPEDKTLQGLEYELSLSVPDRLALLKRMHALGLLQDQDRAEELESAGCSRLAKWHRAGRQLRWVSRFVDGMLTRENLLASPVGLEWFVDGPFMQRSLDPLHHLKFALHHHIKRKPPGVSSSFVVSMGGRISGAFFYRLGPGAVPQLVRGGEPPPESAARAIYPYQKSSAGDRFCELAARAIRVDLHRWGGRLAWAWLEVEPEHGQSWVEVGVSLFQLGLGAEARACLAKARECGHDFSVTGELAPIWELEQGEVPTNAGAFSGWEEELGLLDEEELTALAISSEVRELHPFSQALRKLAHRKQFLNLFLGSAG